MKQIQVISKQNLTQYCFSPSEYGSCVRQINVADLTATITLGSKSTRCIFFLF